MILIPPIGKMALFPVSLTNYDENSMTETARVEFKAAFTHR